MNMPLSPVCPWPQVSFVGATEEQAREAAQKAGYGDKLAVVKTSFRANSKVSGTQGGRAELHQVQEIVMRNGGQRAPHWNQLDVERQLPRETFAGMEGRELPVVSVGH